MSMKIVCAGDPWLQTNQAHSIISRTSLLEVDGQTDCKACLRIIDKVLVQRLGDCVSNLSYLRASISS